MTSETLEIAQNEFKSGKVAFERGQYRASVQYLETACDRVPRNSRLGGEIQLWLVTAYEALGERTAARTLCKQLETHPSYEIRQQSSRLLYILEAPELKRPPEWMTQIPDLSAMPESDLKERRGAGVSRKPASAPEPEDLSQMNTRDNQFIWVALLVAILTLGSLIWLS